MIAKSSHWLYLVLRRRPHKKLYSNNNHSSLLSLWNLKIMKDYYHSTCACFPTLWQSLTHLGAVEGYARASNLVNKSGSEPQLVYTPTADKGKPANQDQNSCLMTPYPISDARIPTRREKRDSNPQHANMLSRHIYC
jgi:hypothetical protein